MRRHTINTSLTITQRLASGITRKSVSVWSSSGHSNQDSITTQGQEQQPENLEALRMELDNISEKLAAIQQRKSSEAYDISKSIESTKAALVALYTSIGYEAGIKTLVGEVEKEGGI